MGDLYLRITQENATEEGPPEGPHIAAADFEIAVVSAALGIYTTEECYDILDLAAASNARQEFDDLVATGINIRNSQTGTKNRRDILESFANGITALVQATERRSEIPVVPQNAEELRREIRDLANNLSSGSAVGTLAAA